MFVVRFHKDTGAEGYFKKGPSEENIFITFDETSNTLQTKQVTKFNEIMDMIDEAVKSTCNEFENEEFSTCITDNIMEEVNRIIISTKELKKYRNIMADRLIDYICDDQLKINESIAIKTEQFNKKFEKSSIKSNGTSIEILSETERSKIWIVKDWISMKECSEIENNGLKVTTTSSSPSSDSNNNNNIIITNIDGSISSSSTMKVDLKVPLINTFLNNSIHKRYILDEDYPDQDPLW